MTELNMNEVLMYLGHRGQKLTPEVEEQIRRCMDQVKVHAAPRLVYVRLPVIERRMEGVAGKKQRPHESEKESTCRKISEKEIKGLPIGGKDIGKLLEPCREAVLLAVTLGSQIEQLLMRREVTDMAEAVILDSCASVAVENVCDCFEEDMRRQIEQEGVFLSSRVSPGYGDFPLETQKRMCEVLNVSRRIGLTVTENFLLVPRKSVTAIMGISEEPFTLRSRGCEVCNMFLNCAYRKRGVVCYE
ncbi:MAG: hypothetical protein LUD14_00460 [Clostridiales bacterium]|nr:hypothetical protein [Clostridiales bacterium]